MLNGALGSTLGNWGPYLREESHGGPSFWLRDTPGEFPLVSVLAAGLAGYLLAPRRPEIGAGLGAVVGYFWRPLESR